MAYFSPSAVKSVMLILICVSSLPQMAVLDSCSVQILAMAKRNRVTFGTQMNHNSSRSHALLTITVLGTDLISGAKTCGETLAMCLVMEVLDELHLL